MRGNDGGEEAEIPELESVEFDDRNSDREPESAADEEEDD